MDRMKVIVGILIVIVLFGLSAGVQSQGVDDGFVAVYLRRRRA